MRVPLALLLAAASLTAACTDIDEATPRRSDPVTTTTLGALGPPEAPDPRSWELSMAGAFFAPTTVPPSKAVPSSRQVSRSARYRPAPSGDLLARIAACEGYPRYVYADHGPESSASGKYGYLDGTWNNYKGYRRAMDAPEWVQDERAASDLARLGTRPWRASQHCWG